MVANGAGDGGVWWSQRAQREWSRNIVAGDETVVDWEGMIWVKLLGLNFPQHQKQDG